MPSIFRFGAGSRSTHIALVACALLIVAAIALVIAWPAVVRHLVVSQLEAMTHRQVDVETIGVNPFTGRIAVAGLRVHDRDGELPLAELARLDARIKPLSLLAGHVWIRDAVFEAPTIRLIRYGDTFNISDLLEREPSEGRALDTTVDRIVVTRGLVTFEDRALSEPRTWRSENIEIEGNEHLHAAGRRHGDRALGDRRSALHARHAARAPPAGAPRGRRGDDRARPEPGPSLPAARRAGGARARARQLHRAGRVRRARGAPRQRRRRDAGRGAGHAGPEGSRGGDSEGDAPALRPPVPRRSARDRPVRDGRLGERARPARERPRPLPGLHAAREHRGTSRGPSRDPASSMSTAACRAADR